MYDDSMIQEADAAEKRRTLLLLSVVELLVMSVWFSAAAVVPQLTAEWNLSGADQAWLTMSVQIGFVAGALVFSLFNVADLFPAQQFIAISAVAGAAFTAAIPAFSCSATSAIWLRFFTGVAMAGVYPPGMKIMASWCKVDRGSCIGLLVGALTVGSGLPHLLAAFSGQSAMYGIPDWRAVLFDSSLLAIVGAIIARFWIRTGPFLAVATENDWRHVTTAFTHRATRLANFGYFGHMWELYAVWAWAPLMLVASYSEAGWSPNSARLAAFGIFLVGGVSSLVAGRWADYSGRTIVTSASLSVSAFCCLTVGLVFHSPFLLTALCMIWGFSVIADSAQFSAAVSELSDSRYVGTALQVQTSIGFLISMVTLRLVPMLVDSIGWEYAFLILAPGPALGVISMLALRRDPDAENMAGGMR